MSKADLKVDWATHEAAKYACEHWHYSKCLPKFKLVKIGAWENENYIGAIIFSVGSNRNIGSPYGLLQVQCCELTRVALQKHSSPVSRIVKVSLKLLKQHCPGLRLVVSYSDIQQGHHGGIYQAGNWVYNGKSKPQRSLIIDGLSTHKRTATLKFGTAIPEIISKITGKKVKWSDVECKHVYLMPLDPEMRAKIAPLAKPYPKRPKQAMTGDHPVQRQCDTDQDAPYSALSAVSG